MARDERLVVLVLPEEKEMILQAAQYVGRTYSDFVRSRVVGFSEFLLMVENGQLNDDTLKALDGVRTDLILLGRDQKDKE